MALGVRQNSLHVVAKHQIHTYREVRAPSPRHQQGTIRDRRQTGGLADQFTAMPANKLSQSGQKYVEFDIVLLLRLIGAHAAITKFPYGESAGVPLRRKEPATARIVCSQDHRRVSTQPYLRCRQEKKGEMLVSTVNAILLHWVRLDGAMSKRVTVGSVHLRISTATRT